MTSTKTFNFGLGKVKVNLDLGGKVIDYATNKILKVLAKNPEEIVRQWYEHVLIDELGYDPNQIEIEVPITMGVTTKKADIVVYDTPLKNLKIIIVETKQLLKKEGIEQLHGYLEAAGTEFGVWTNGNDISYWYHEKSQSFEPIGRIIRQGETVDDIGTTKLRKELAPAKDLVSDFKAAEQYIIAHQGGTDVFDEIFKIIFAKIFDEKKHLKTPTSEAHFRAGIKEPASSVKRRICLLFSGAKRLYSDVFKSDEEIILTEDVTKWLVLLLQNYLFSETDMDVLGVGFEILVNPKMKSDKGQYFTPRQVVRAAVEMLQIDEDMSILDPACGSGGFLIYSMERVWKKLNHEWASDLDALAEKLTFAQNKVFGLDYDDRLVRVAKAYMAIWGDGRSHIYYVPCSIKSYEWRGEISERIKEDSFDAVLTNPPFAGDLDLINIAHHFDLGKKNGRELSSQRKDILFIEKVLKFAKISNKSKNVGLIGIILPKGDLDEREKQYVRDYILKNSQILAVIALHRLTFVPFTMQKTSLVILKRMNEKNIPKDYNIFMAVSEKPGKDKSGNLKYQKDNSGNIILDEFKRPKVYSDLADIAKEFVRGKPKIGFWVKKSELMGRINAEFYHPKYMKIRNKVTKKDYMKLGSLLISDEGIINGKDLSAVSSDSKRHYVEDGTPYIRVGDVKENEIDLIGAEKIDETKYDLSSISKLLENDLLVTRKGTTGRAAVVSKYELNVILSSEIIRLRFKKEIIFPSGRKVKLNPYFIAAYINSSFGKALILQKQTGGISEGINHPDLIEIEIPFPSQKEIDRIASDYKSANQKLRNARMYIETMSTKIEKLLN
ncbi:MAG: N-6 DNA methylase [Candidatus Thermoplasmatota archaeon]|nr:N-6 DNA methylase [Candidatus Thermoplasmatota archaeon]